MANRRNLPPSLADLLTNQPRRVYILYLLVQFINIVL